MRDLLPLALLTACEVPGVVKGPAGLEGEDSADTAQDTAQPEVEPRAEILSPEHGATVENPVTFTLAAEGVARVSLDADGYALGDPWDPTTSTTLVYTFNGTGYERLITLTATDEAGQVVATDQVTITVQGEGVQLDVPYFYQYDNTHEPGSTCGITSAAMLLDYWNPGSVTPDSLYVDYGKSQGQSPYGLAALYEAEGLYADWTTSGTRDALRAHLDAGRPVIAHGWWTDAGHVVVIVGYDDQDWIVNDPAGDWYDCYGCGGGEAVRYPIGGAWDELMSTDGDLWLSAASDSPF